MVPCPLVPQPHPRAELDILPEGWQKLHDRHGSLPWSTLFQPAIDLAENGFPVNTDLADAIAQYSSPGTNTTTPGFILRDPGFARTYAPGGVPLKEGDWVYRKDLARTLRTIADEGVEAFYNGSIARGIVETVLETGGIMTYDDLQGYEAIVREPVNATYR